MALDTKQSYGRKGFILKTVHFTKDFLFKKYSFIAYKGLTVSIDSIARAIFTW